MYWLIYLAKPLIFTCILEVIGAYFLGYRHYRDDLLVILANIITNPFLNAVIALLYEEIPVSMHIPGWILLEILVIVCEYLIYKKYLGDHPLRTSVILNLLSIGGGLVWQMLR